MRVTVVVALLLTACGPRADWVAELKEGDIVFQISRSAQSLAVQRATGSRYSHMGMVLMRGGQPCVFEAVSVVRCTAVAAAGDGDRTLSRCS